MVHSFWIETKLFEFYREGGNFIYISEKSWKIRKSLYLSGGMATLMANVVENFLRSLGKI